VVSDSYELIGSRPVCEYGMAFDFESVKQLVACPQTKTELVCDGDCLVNTDPETRFSYPIIDAIPLLLPSEAKQLSLEEWSKIMNNQQRDPQRGSKLV